MSGVLAVFKRDLTLIHPVEIQGMLLARPERGPNGQHSWMKGPTALAHQHFWITPEEQGEEQPLTDPRGEVGITADVRLDNRPELAHLLELDPVQARNYSDAWFLLLAYQKWGEDCLARLLGDFAFVIWDGRSHKLFAARDALGNRDICFRITEQTCLLASEISQILAFPGVDACLNENKVAEWIPQLWDDQTMTFYQDIYYLPPAHAILVTPEAVRTWKYWQIDPQKRVEFQTEDNYIEQYLELMTDAVRNRLRTKSRVALSMSGGLDSTALAGLIVRINQLHAENNPALRTYSYAFDELEACDERQWIRGMVDYLDLDTRYVICDGLWPLRDLASWPLTRDYVLSDAYALLPDALMRQAGQDGIHLLHAGYYGDALFAGGSYWAAELISDFKWLGLATYVLKHTHNINLRWDLIGNGIWPVIPDSIKHLYRRLLPRRSSFDQSLHPDFIQRTQLHERKNRSDWTLRREFNSISRWSRYQLLFHNSWAQGASATRHFYNLHGMELEVPYQDRSLVEFIMAIPAYILEQPGNERSLHRKALKSADILPNEILYRKSKTSFESLLEKGIPLETSTILDLFAKPQIIEREFVQKEWLSKHLQQLPQREAFSALWIWIALELWLQAYF